MKILVLSALLMLNSVALAGFEMHSFTSDPFSFTIGAPLTWTLLPASFPTEEYRLHNQNLYDLVSERHMVPIIRIVKPIHETQAISPAVQVFVEPDEGETPVEYLATTIKMSATSYRDFRIVKAPSDNILNGTKAAFMECTFVVEYSGGRSFPTDSRLWAIGRDKMMFVIAVSGEPDDLKALSQEIDMIMGTVRFKKE